MSIDGPKYDAMKAEFFSYPLDRAYALSENTELVPAGTLTLKPKADLDPIAVHRPNWDSTYDTSERYGRRTALRARRTCALGPESSADFQESFDGFVGQFVSLLKRKPLPNRTAFVRFDDDDVRNAPHAQLVLHSLLGVDGTIELDLWHVGVLFVSGIGRTMFIAAPLSCKRVPLFQIS